MTKKMSEQEMLSMAQQRVAAMKTFYHSLLIYFIINLMLVGIWAIGGRGSPWFLWVSFFWGIGLAFQALRVFLFPKEGGNWEREHVQKELDRIKKTQP